MQICNAFSIASSNQVIQSIDDLLHDISRAFDAPLCGLLLSDSTVLRIENTVGIDLATVPTRNIPLGQGLSGRHITEPKFGDTITLGEKPDILEPYYRGNLAYSRLFYNNKIIGILNICRPSPMPAFTQAEVQSLVAFSTQIVFALINYYTIQQKTAELRATQEALIKANEQLREDIAQRERITAELKTIQAQQRAMMDNIPGIVWMKDLQGKFLAINEPFARSCGHAMGEIIGKTDFDIWPGQLAERYVQDDKAVMASGKRSEVEEPVADSINGMRYIETIKTPIFNEHGHVTGTVGIARDITDRRLNEAALKKANNDLRRNERALQNMLFDLKKAQDHVKQAHRQLLQSEKLASIGQLAAGVAHEINNPISFISSNLSTLQKYIGILAALHTQCDAINTALKADDIPLAHTLLKDIQEMKEREDIPFLLHDTQNLIRESQDGIERIKKIVIDLRTFSRKDEETMSPANLNTILDGILSIVWNEIKYKAEVRKEYGVIGNVRCNQQQIGQVFINILVNAAQAIKENGIIQLHTYEENERIIVEITDNGSGIPEEIIDRVFDPFFTTKEVGKGTGLGLSISYDIIKKHNGSIDVESESGMGTTFRIALPRTDK